MKITRNTKRSNDENQNPTIFTLEMLHFSKPSITLEKCTKIYKRFYVITNSKFVAFSNRDALVQIN